MWIRRPAFLALVALLTLISVPRADASAVPGPRSAPEYWFARWDVHALWASGARGQGVTIGEIDTGVTASLPALRGRILPGTDFGLGGDGQIDREISTFGHGTAMASIMVARPGLLGITGLAPDAKILPIAVPLEGTTDAKRPDRLASAITWAVDHGANIVNLSIGGKQYPGHGAVPCPPAEQRAVFHALERNVVVVAAIGNTGPTTDTVEDPASCLGVVSVGAVNRQGQLARFSTQQPYLTLVAPGVNIPSLGRKAGDAFAGDGTSQATALVSASLALAESAHRGITARQLVTRLVATLDERTARPDAEYGYGQLNAQRLVRANVPATATNPVYAAAQPFYARYLALEHPSLPAPDPAGRVAAAVRVAGRPTQASTSRELGWWLAVGGLLVLGALLLTRGRFGGGRDGSPR